jgi:hypothetical protein
MKNFRKGDKVEWNFSGGTAKGVVEKKITSSRKIKGHEVKASPSNPEYLVKSNNGGEAAHKPGALKKR